MDKWFYNPGGTNTISFQNFTNWYSAPGGPSGGGSLVSYPVGGDNAYLTSESGNGTITINNSVQVDGLDCRGFTGRVSGGGLLTVYQEIILGPTVIFSMTATLIFYGYIINSSGNTFTGNIDIYSGLGGNPVCETIDLKTNGFISLNAGELRTNSLLNNYGLEAAGFGATTNNVKSFFQISSNNNNWNITTTNGTAWYVENASTTCIDPVNGMLGVVYLTGITPISNSRFLYHSVFVVGQPLEFIIKGAGGEMLFAAYGASKYNDIIFDSAAGSTNVIMGFNTTVLGNFNFNNSYLSFIQQPTFSSGTTHSILLSPNMTFSSSLTVNNNCDVVIETNPGSITIQGGVTINDNGILTANDTFRSINGFTINSFGTFNALAQSSINGNVLIQTNSYFLSEGNCSMGGTVTINGQVESYISLEIFGNVTINDGILNSYNRLTIYGSMTMNEGGFDTQFGDPSLNIITGVFTLNSGNVLSDNLSIGTFSSSNSNTRSFSVVNLFLTGSGTIMSISSTNQTNLNFDVANITVRANDSVSRTLTLNNKVSAYGDVTLEGNGNGATTMNFNVNSDYYPWVKVTKQNGTLSIGTSTMRSLTFVEGSTITWSSTSTINIIEEELRLCNSMTVGSTPGTISFPTLNEFSAPNFYTANKTFAGILTIDALYGLNIYGNYTSSSTSTSAINISNYGQNNFYNNVSLPNNGNITIDSGQGTGSGFFAEVYILGNTTVNSIGWIDAYVYISNTTVTTSINASSSGGLYVYPNSIINIGFNFSSNSSGNFRYITLNNAIINMNGSGFIWNIQNGISQGVLEFNGFDATVNINNKSTALCTLALGGVGIGNININRSNNISSSTTSTTFTGLGNTHRNFRDFTILHPTSVHQITFASSSIGTPTFIYDTFQVGNSTNRTNLISSSVSNRFYLQKLNPGLVICPNVLVQLSTTFNSNTWYAISGSSDVGGNTNWIFNSTVPRRLSSLGVG